MTTPPTVNRSTVYTVGHGNRQLEELETILIDARIDVVVDVRRYPSSKRNPQFNAASLATVLTGGNIRYVHKGAALGGHRTLNNAEQRTGLASDSLRAYAEHCAGATFRQAMQWLIETAKTERVAILCAEQNPAACHRSLIADYLSFQAITVCHLTDISIEKFHVPHRNAHFDGTTLRYSRPQLDLF